MVLSYNSTHDESQEETRGKTSTNLSGFLFSYLILIKGLHNAGKRSPNQSGYLFFVNLRVSTMLPYFFFVWGSSKIEF